MTPQEVLAIAASWAPEALKLLDDGLHLLMAQKQTEAEQVKAARDTANTVVDAYEAAKAKS